MHQKELLLLHAMNLGMISDSLNNTRIIISTAEVTRIAGMLGGSND